ncbi:MAG: hypothetical protein KF892_23935 [Rhizobacter sp.]|nr:hypothetical protein [Rhizobacter sp.]
MPTITFSYPAGVFDFNQVDPETGESGVFVEDVATLRSLDGLLYDEEVFSDHIGDGELEAIAGIGISGGSLAFAFDARSKQLIAKTKYSLTRPLKPKEVELLKSYTVGQWSDGIGSNFFQDRMHQGLAPQALVMDEKHVVVQQES